jgi:anti-sigma B factor antagonist
LVQQNLGVFLRFAADPKTELAGKKLPPARGLRAPKPRRAVLYKTKYDAGTSHEPQGAIQMSIVLSEKAIGPVTLLELGERLTIENLSDLRDCIESLSARERRLLLLDCSRISVIDSRGIGGLMRNWLSLKRDGGNLKLLKPSARLREVLQVVGLHKVIDCFDDIGLALRAF